MQKSESIHFTRRWVLVGIAGAVAKLAGCGGGSDVAGLSSGGTGSFTSGPITGLGSIIVNGIRYNDDNATVFNADGVATSRSAMKLGMVVNIQGSALTPASTAAGLRTATAERITFESEWIGPVSNVGASTFELLGHTVDVLSTTIFDGSALRLSELSSAHFVEIYGYVDPVDGHIQASRIEVTTVQPSSYKLSGAIAQLNRGSRTASLGRVAVQWALDSAVPTSLSNGDFVKVVLSPTPAGGVWNATRIQVLNSPLVNLSDGDDYEAEVQGSITAYQSNASFEVAGIPVNASNAQFTGVVGLGAHVEVKGRISAGQLLATKVEVKTSSDIEAQEFEFYGVVSTVTAQTFVVHGETFYYDGNTQNRQLLTMSPLPYVEVKATRINGRWYAFEIDIED